MGVAGILAMVALFCPRLSQPSLSRAPPRRSRRCEDAAPSEFCRRLQGKHPEKSACDKPYAQNNHSNSSRRAAVLCRRSCGYCFNDSGAIVSPGRLLVQPGPVPGGAIARAAPGKSRSPSAFRTRRLGQPGSTQCTLMTHPHAGNGVAPLVIFNRLPKCGSTTMINLFWKHSKARWLRRHHIKSEAPVTYSVFNSAHYRPKQPFQSGTKWTVAWDELRKAALHTPVQDSRENPAPNSTLFINHMSWPNLTAAGLPRPTGSFQVLRDPIDRVVSAYYYGMWGPRDKINMDAAKRKKMGQMNMTTPPTVNQAADYMLSKSWVQRKRQLARSNKSRYWSCHVGETVFGKMNLMTEYFCGFGPECSDLCSDRALARAKHVLRTEYMLVGMLEELNTTVKLLERVLPSWFAGLHEVFTTLHEGGEDRMRRRQGVKGTQNPLIESPSPTTRQLLEEWNAPDIELYAVAKQLFYRKKACL